MRILKWAAGIVLALVLVIVGGGLLLPRSYTVQRDIVINAPPERVYALVASPKQWVRWTVWNQRDPNMAITYSGPDSGAGAGWSWVSSSEGSGSMQFTAVETDRRIVYTLSFPEFDSSSTGALTLVPEGAATRVRWSIDGDMGGNPVWRWMTLFMDRLVGGDFAAGLANLKSLAEKG